MMRTFFKSKQFAAYALLCGALLACSAGWLAAQAPAASTPAPAPAAMPIAAPAAAPAPAPTEATSTLTIRITGIRNAKGKIGVALFRDGKGFPSEIASAIAATQVEIDPQTLTAKAVFEKLPQGVYAASLLHDENLVGHMEFDSQGIPQSGYGLSNNPDTTQGPPTAEQANFKVSQPEAAIEIKMVYWQ
jgi:uncharacterized protein (DUF2141 family)